MAHFRFTANLRRYFPELKPEEIQEATVIEAIDKLNERYPGIKGYICEDQGELRQHVQIFIGDEQLKDRQGLSDAIGSKDEVYIMQALSGG